LTVASRERGRERVIVASSDGLVFEYWHITARVLVGQSVTADETVLGTILKPAAHVHLTEVRGGRPVNPLESGHLTPYRDATTPRVDAIGIELGSGNAATANFSPTASCSGSRGRRSIRRGFATASTTSSSPRPTSVATRARSPAASRSTTGPAGSGPDSPWALAAR